MQIKFVLRSLIEHCYENYLERKNFPQYCQADALEYVKLHFVKGRSQASEQARKLGRCDSCLRNLKLWPTDSLTDYRI